MGQSNKKKMEELEKRHKAFMADLAGMEPGELIEIYILAKYGENGNAAMPLMLFNEAAEKIENILDSLSAKLN
jgi:hypothetical protein